MLELSVVKQSHDIPEYSHCVVIQQVVQSHDIPDTPTSSTAYFIDNCIEFLSYVVLLCP